MCEAGGSGLCICFKAPGLCSMGYLFLNEQKEKIQPTHRSGMGFKAIKQNKDGPPFYNEGDECTRLVGVVYVFVLKPMDCVPWVTCF